MSHPASWLTALIPAMAVLASTVPAGAQNTPPVIDPIPPLITLEDRPLHDVVVRVTDAQSPASQIILSVLRPPSLAATAISGAGEERRLSIDPYPSANGVEMIQLLARDPHGATSQIDVSLTVLAVDDPPEFDPLPDLVLAPGSQGNRVAVGLRDRDTILSRIKLGAIVSDESVLTTNRLSFRWEGARAWLIIGLPANAAGSTVITLQASDETTTASTSFQLDIRSPAFKMGQVLSRSANAVLDLNADGLMDVYSSNTSPASVLLTPGAFQQQAVVPLPSRYAALTWGDFDGDGDLDALGGSRSVPTTWPAWQLLRTDLLSSNSVSLVGITNLLPTVTEPIQPVSALSADFDMDGDLDVILTGLTSRSYSPSYLRNEGAAGFAQVEAGLPVGGVPLAWADLDLDGDNDLLFRSNSTEVARSQSLSVYANDGSGNFNLQTTFASLASSIVTAGALDLDGDGRLDLWAELQDAGLRAHELVVWRQESGRFIEHFRLTLSWFQNVGIPPVAWGDFDQDGSSDLLAAVSVGQTFYSWPQLYLNDGAARLRALPLTSVTNTGTGWTSLPAFQAVDFNGDRRLDFYASLNNATQRWTNTLSGVSAPVRSMPTRLQAVLFGPVLWLSWDEPVGLPERLRPTYNVRVGTQPGANDVVPSMARADGKRLLVAPGNAGHRRQLVIKLAEPPPRRLCWSVQAIDAAYQGGPFAGELTLAPSSPDNQPPQVGFIPDLTMNEDETREIEFAVIDDATPGDRLIVGAGASNLQLFPPGSLTPPPGNPSPVSGVRRLRLKPRQDLPGSALVTVAAFDEAGLSGSRSFKVTVLPVADWPVPQIRTALQGSLFVIGFDADAYSKWQLEVSTNLVEWLPLGEVTEFGSYPLSAQLAAPARAAHEFFRLRQVE